MGKKSTVKKIHEKHTAKKQILRGFYVSFDPTENTMKAIHGNLKFTEIHDPRVYQTHPKPSIS